jgi:hypothetical protein
MQNVFIPFSCSSTTKIFYDYIYQKWVYAGNSQRSSEFISRRVDEGFTMGKTELEEGRLPKEVTKWRPVGKRKRFRLNLPGRKGLKD